MNKFTVLCGLSILAGAAIAEQTESVIGQVGVTAVTSNQKNTIVAVSFGDLATGGNIKAADLVSTQNLTEGDQLCIYDGSKYETWKLEDGAWREADQTFSQDANGDSQGVGSPASGKEMSVGQGFWLCRKDTPSGAFTFYIYGKPVTAQTSTTTAGVWTLVGNPTQASVVLDDIAMDGVAKHDSIVIIDSQDRHVMYDYSKKNSWTVSGSSEKLEIPAGTGFWMKTASACTIRWTEKKQLAQ